MGAQEGATHLPSPSLSFHAAPKHVPSVTSFSTLQELSCHKVCVTTGHHVDAFPVFPYLPPLWEYHSNPDMRKSSNTRMVGFSLAKSFHLNSCMENLPLVLGHAQEWEKEELEFVRLWVSSWFLLVLWQNSPSEPVWENATQSPFMKSQLPFQCKSNYSTIHFCDCCGEGHRLLQVLSIPI